MMQFNWLILLLLVVAAVIAELDISLESNDSMNANISSLIINRRVKRRLPPCFTCPNIQFVMDVHCAHFKYLFTMAQLAGRKKRSLGYDCTCCGCCSRNRRSILRNHRSQLQHFKYVSAKK